MKKVNSKRIRRSRNGVNVVADVNTVVNTQTALRAQTPAPGRSATASARQRVRIVQRSRGGLSDDERNSRSD